jgi:UDP-N-acetylmuramoyl-tripeptide--D-alanyl-D-alanine ligase
MRNQSAAFRVCDVLVEEMARTSFTLVTPEGQRRTCIPAAGEHLALNAAGVAAVASVLGVGLDQVAERLGALTLPDGRGRTYAAVNGAVLYDDTYNSSPTSLSAALDVLAASGAAERVAVLGDMLELGAAAPEQHVRAGQLAAAKATSLVAVGEYATTIRDAAVNAGLPPARARVAGDAEEAAREAAALCRPGAVVLVKASRAVALDEVVRRLRDGT